MILILGFGIIPDALGRTILKKEETVEMDTTSRGVSDRRSVNSEECQETLQVKKDGF